MLVLQQFLNGRNDLRITAGAQNAVHLRQFLPNLVGIALGQAAGHENFPHPACLFQFCHPQNMIDGLALGGINKPAGINDHHVAVHHPVADRVPGFLDPEHHPFAVHLVFGAAQGNKSDRCHNLLFLPEIIVVFHFQRPQGRWIWL